MTKLRVHAFGISVDGYGAGPSQDLENPLGIGGKALHDWFFSTRTFQRIIGNDGGTTGVDDDFAARGFDNIGAWIIGRNMFGPVRGPWPDETWKGWWGENPALPYSRVRVDALPPSPLSLWRGRLPSISLMGNLTRS